MFFFDVIARVQTRLQRKRKWNDVRCLVVQEVSIPFAPNLIYSNAVNSFNNSKHPFKMQLRSYRGIYFHILALFLTVFVTHETKISETVWKTNLGRDGETETPMEKCEAVAEPFSSCACKMKTSGGVINLNGIISNCSYEQRGCVKPRFTITGDYTADDWTYSYHPCFDFSLFQNETHVYPGYRPCKNVAAARYTRLSTHECDGLGHRKQAVFKRRKIDEANFIISNLTLEFQNKTTQNSALINLVCNMSLPVNESKLTFLGVKNFPYNMYIMALESPCCCPNGCFLGLSPSTKVKPTVTEDFWFIIAIAGGILLLLIIFISVVRFKKTKRDPIQKPLLDPLS